MTVSLLLSSTYHNEPILNPKLTQHYITCCYMYTVITDDYNYFTYTLSMIKCN